MIRRAVEDARSEMNRILDSILARVNRIDPDAEKKVQKLDWRSEIKNW